MGGRARYERFDDYVNDQPAACREALRELRAIILEAAPDAAETFNYGIPAFTLIDGGKREEQIMIAGYRKHVGLYPHPTTIEQFHTELSQYTKGKGSVQFPLTEPLPRELIREMVRYRRLLVRGRSDE